MGKVSRFRKLKPCDPFNTRKSTRIWSEAILNFLEIVPLDLREKDIKSFEKDLGETTKQRKFAKTLKKTKDK
jgi:hypothetical protein